uniref:Uncharacterized protein n=1 Tax=Glossina austeni TaxID=7395 RepID=A0A1A9UHX4_GLOAU
MQPHNNKNGRTRAKRLAEVQLFDEQKIAVTTRAVQAGQAQIQQEKALKIDEMAGKIDKLRETQGILNVDEVYQQFEGKVKVFEGKVGDELSWSDDEAGRMS